MINPGKLTRRLHFLDVNGNQISPDYWCQIKHINSTSMYIAGTLGQVESIEVRMRYVLFGPNADTAPYSSMSFKIDGTHIFTIKTIENVDLANEEWHIIATRALPTS